jgi:hypothetical protein
MANVKRRSTILRSSLSASVQSCVHTPALLGDKSASMGLMRCLKFGMKGEAHKSRPSTCCKSYRLEGSPVPNHFFKLFVANLYVPPQISIPTKVQRCCIN